MAKYSWVNRGNALLVAVVMISSLAASLFSPIISKAAASWDAEYWNLDAPTAYPAIPDAAADLTRTDTDIDFNWSTGSPDPSINADGFVARWVADQTFETGYYHFEITADDGYRVYIDNEVVIDMWMDNDGGGAYQSTRYISAGTHEVKVEYYEHVNNARITFSYSKVTLAEHEDAIQIYDCEDLQAMNDDLTADYQLANNIDCSATSTWNSGEGFVPVGDDSVEKFTGSLDGNGKLISNLTINRPAYTEPVGLFGVVFAESVVKDLYIANANISGNSNVGILAGKLTGTASNVRTSGTVVGADENAGGLVGWHYHAVVGGYTIMDCVSSADVTGGYFVGGLVGYNEESSISHSSALGEVNGQGYVGGLVGYNEGSTIEYSYATGNVSSTDSGGEFGGLVGASGFGIISKSFATGNVAVESLESGGLIGASHDTTVYDVFAEGDVAGGTEYMGGLIGIFSTDSLISVRLSNAYATGNVATDAVDSASIGGLIGDAYNAQISNVYSTGSVAVNNLVSTLGSIGGLIGSMNSAAQLSNASSEGDVTVLSASAVGGIGGLIGLVSIGESAQGLIEKSYSTGDVSNSAEDSYTGGLIGYITGGVESGLELYDLYSTGTVGGYNAISGLIGFVGVNEDSYVSIHNTFSVGEIMPLDEYTDSSGVVGAFEIDLGVIEEFNTFWDSETTGVTFADTYYGIGAQTTEDMKNIRTFTDLAFNGDLQDEPVFDFVGTQYDDVYNEDVWAIDGTTNNGYPFLNFDQDFDFSSFSNLDADPETDTTEFESINNGDTNDDDIFDDLQQYVSAFDNSVSGTTGVLEVSEECFVISVDASSETSQSTQDSGHSYPAGLMDFMIECETPGATVTVTQYFYGLSSSDITARKFDAISSGYSTISGAVVSETTIAGQTVTKVTYQITDGGELDEDGVANGTIIDPSGPGFNNVGVPNTGLRRIDNSLLSNTSRHYFRPE